ncbi:hypothetical protein JCM10212_003424 [Sporobolomyces blumeae]
MPGASSRSTRNSSSRSIPFASSKTAVAAKSSSKPDPITLLFRREVQSLLATPPCLPSHVPADTPVEVVACVERLSLSGIQQSVQLCQAGGETWVTRTEGARQYFPRAGRVQKRLRGGDDEADEEARDGDEHEMIEADSSTSSRKKSKKKARKGHHDQVERDEIETPVGSTTSSRRHKAVPAAPLKHKRHRRSSRRIHEHDGDDAEFDDGASTETEGSYLAGTRGVRSPAMLTSIDEEREQTQFGRGQRRCFGRANLSQRGTPTEDVAGRTKVKSEADESDDLASLCGRVGDLEFRSTVDPESECEKTPAPSSAEDEKPTISRSLDKGKGRA